MAIRDIVTLEKSFAPCLLRILYPLALAIIAVAMLLGVAQGIRVITRPPMTPPPVAAPGAVEQMRPPGMMGPRMMERRRMMRGMRAGNPVLAGSFIILRTLVGGAILMMIVRILSEMALAVLRLPKGNAAS